MSEEVAMNERMQASESVELSLLLGSVFSLSLWKPCMPLSGYFFPQFTISMKASACSHLFCRLPGFRGHSKSDWKGSGG